MIYSKPMGKNIITRIDDWIRYAFYAIFFLVPLVMYPYTFELFEFNKMWTVFGISLIILFLWTSKMVITKKIFIRRTPLDIVLLLFLASQIIATLLSMDPYVSFWGYYSRFNGGLLSTITYVFLYYAYVTNVIDDKKDVPHSIRMIAVTLASGILVALWGFPSHFGADPTCLVFRGTLDVSCWSAGFYPTLRIFSTLGQPNWMAAYIAVLIPIVAAFALLRFKKTHKKNVSPQQGISMSFKSFSFLTLTYIAVSALFYVDLIYTDSKSGFIGFWVGNIIFIIGMVILLMREFGISLGNAIKSKFAVTILIINVIFLLLNFLQSSPLHEFDKYSLPGIEAAQHQTTKPVTQSDDGSPAAGSALDIGGTDSGTIRLIVWQGALDIFYQHPLFGTGPETFAFAYYKVRPAAHNLTSEWDYLYNKAHNEYLNYLSTSGIIGLGTYLAFIALFFYTAFMIYRKKTYQGKYLILSLALIGGFISILVSNFFGFSVVIINLFLFLIPLWFYDITDQGVLATPNTQTTNTKINASNMTFVTIFFLITLFLEVVLYRYWIADQDYALGNNLDKAGQYIQATQPLTQATELRPSEDVFKDELATNLSTIAVAYSESPQEGATQAAKLYAAKAKQLSDQVIADHPNNVVYWKSRTRDLYLYAHIDPSQMKGSLQAIEQAHELAPTDAKILYNEALLQNQAGQTNQAIQSLRQTIKLKSNYRDAYYSLALILSTQAKAAQTNGDSESAAELNKEAKQTLQYLLKNVTPGDKPSEELLKSL